MRRAADLGRLDRRRARLVRDLGVALSTLPLDGPSALEAHIAEIQHALEADVAMAYGVLDLGDCLDVRFVRGSGGLDVVRFREAFSQWLRGFGGKTGWGAYNPVLPERDQRNRVISSPRTGRLRNATPVVRALSRRFGLEAQDNVRALICDGPTLLAWVGVYQSGEIAPWQRTALGMLIAPLRKRLIIERRLERDGTTRAALEVLLESTGSAAFILSERGAIEPGNGLARAALRTDRKATVEALRAALRDEGSATGYTVTPLDTRDSQRSYLAIASAPSAPLHRAKAAAAKGRFGLSPRHAQVLELLLQGTTNIAIASALSISPSTVEKHVAALFERAGVPNRYALVARVTAL